CVHLGRGQNSVLGKVDPVHALLPDARAGGSSPIDEPQVVIERHRAFGIVLAVVGLQSPVDIVFHMPAGDGHDQGMPTGKAGRDAGRFIDGSPGLFPKGVPGGHVHVWACYTPATVGEILDVVLPVVGVQVIREAGHTNAEEGCDDVITIGAGGGRIVEVDTRGVGAFEELVGQVHLSFTGGGTGAA